MMTTYALRRISDNGFIRYEDFDTPPAQPNPVKDMFWVEEDRPVTPAQPFVPDRVSMRQARIALHRAGLYDAVNAAVTAAGGEALIEWEYSSEVWRNRTLVQAMGAALGLTSQQLDDLFVAAAAIE